MVSHTSHSMRCVKILDSLEAEGSFCHTPKGMLKGQNKSIQLTEDFCTNSSITETFHEKIEKVSLL